ncbi:unnamed protein product [Ambrosiozyma monospora]|uniref:Unnamed protein product n=1 Tax=Ambrosiozyma monospora TaxID=43982 RepID=A0ACB5TAJ4_AMBMO|nr:unnamed protein product [Ambrosiozyma monospora]
MPKVPPITCHVLDTTKGRPATEVKCEISYISSTTSTTPDQPFATAQTNSDGRVPSWTPIQGIIAAKFFESNGEDWIKLTAGVYKIRFFTKEYFQRAREPGSSLTFFPFIDINFEVTEDSTDQHFHVPLLLSNYGYSTYRGS